jgi:hypothetical protein
MALGCASPQPPPDFGAVSAPRYAWLAPIAPDDPAMRASLRRAIDAELQARGCRPASGVNPDFYVAYRVDIDRRTVLRNEKGSEQFLTSFHGPTYSVSSVRQVPEVIEEGRLVIAIADPQQRELWHGVARAHSSSVFSNDAVATVARAFTGWPKLSHRAAD